MNYQNTIKSPRASMPGMSINNQIGEVASLQQFLLEKDQQISNLQGTINKLELKNKQCLSFQQAMIQYQSKFQENQAELLKVKEKLRTSNIQIDQLKKKLDIQLKQKKERASSFVRHEDYMKLSNDFKKFRQVHRNCDHSIKQIQKQKLGVEGQLKQLKQQINSLNNVINTKNSEINELKLQKYNIKSNISIQSQKQLTKNQGHTKSSTNIISSFKVIGDDNTSVVIGDQNKMNYQLISYSRQNDQLRQKIHKLQQQLNQYLHSSTQWSTKVKNDQYAKIIQEYEANLANMTSKMSSVYKLQMQKNALQQQKRNLLVRCEQLTQQLASRNVHCQNLQKRLREFEQYRGVNMQSDILNFVTRNQRLTRQVEKLEKTVFEKYQQIIQLKKNLMSLQVTQQTFRLMENSLNNLQQKLNAKNQQLHIQHDRVIQQQQKNFKLQKDIKRMQIQYSELKSQMGKTNRLVSQKVQKIEFQAVQISRLEKQNEQKKFLSEKLARLEVQYKKLQQKYQQSLDQSNQLAMTVIILSLQVERRGVNGCISRQFIQEFDALKIKSKQTEIHAQFLQQRVKRLQHLHKLVVQQTMKVSQHLHTSHKRWNHYDTAMQKLVSFLEVSNKKSQQRFQQLDSNINTWLVQQEKRMSQLAKLDPFDDGPYVKYIGKVTTQPLDPSLITHLGTMQRYN